jgi:hypothetical protein
VRSPICLRRDGCVGVMISVPPPISRFPGSGVSAGGTESPYLDTPPEKRRGRCHSTPRCRKRVFGGHRPRAPSVVGVGPFSPGRSRGAAGGAVGLRMHRRPSPPPRRAGQFRRSCREHPVSLGDLRYNTNGVLLSHLYDGNTTCSRYRTLRHVTRGYVVPSKDYSRPPEEERRARREWPPTRRGERKAANPNGRR